MTDSEIQPQEAQGRGVRRVSGRNAKTAAVVAVAVVAVVVILILALTSASNTIISTPRASLDLDSTAPPPNVPPYSVLLGLAAITSNVTSNVSWSDLRIDLTDGVNQVSWYPPTEGLSGSPFTSYCCTACSLGIMTVTCNITDVLGDGIPLSGDTIELTATSDATFLATQNYTISVIYIPDGGLVCSLTFNGVPHVIDSY